MAPLRSFEVSRRIAVSIDHVRSRVDKKFRAILRGGRGGRPISLYVSQRVLFFLNTFGRAFVAWCTSRLSLSNTVERARSARPSRRTAGERSFPSIPSFPWSAEDKLIPVVLERCYVPFTSAKVVLFLGLFSPFHFHRFLNLFGMCELHLRTVAVAGDHGRKIIFLGVSSAFRQQVQRLGPRCTSNRLHRELVRELARRPLFFCQFVLVTLIQHSLDSSRSRRGAA